MEALAVGKYGKYRLILHRLWRVLVEETHRIKSYHSREALHMLEKEYWTGDQKYIFVGNDVSVSCIMCRGKVCGWIYRL